MDSLRFHKRTINSFADAGYITANEKRALLNKLNEKNDLSTITMLTRADKRDIVYCGSVYTNGGHACIQVLAPDHNIDFVVNYNDYEKFSVQGE